MTGAYCGCCVVAGAVLGSAGQRTDGSQGSANAHRPSAGRLLERCKIPVGLCFVTWFPMLWSRTSVVCIYVPVIEDVFVFTLCSIPVLNMMASLSCIRFITVYRQQIKPLTMTSVLLKQDGSKVFTASCDKTAKMWDLNSNQAMQIAQVRLQPSLGTVESRPNASVYTAGNTKLLVVLELCSPSEYC